MVFSSLYFLFLYFPIVLITYYVTPLKWRNAVLLVFNLIFYGWGEPVYILLMIFTIVLDYFAGLIVHRCKQRDNDKGARWAVAVSLVLNLAILFFFKYWDLVANTFQHIGIPMPVLNLTLPIGISFYTFQTMTYPVDIYRGDADIPKNLVSFGTFVTLFPQLIAGPIIKYKELADQMEHRTHSPEQFASGVQIFTIGLAKKVLLANCIGRLWDVYLATPGAELTTLGAWLGIVAFSLQLYFDFSGYSDMAVGMGRMMGFEFLANFNYPYLAKSATEFWRRWHISLGSWFRDYVYIPLGGSRVGKARWVRNLVIVWGLTGLWHGAAWNFVAWGLYFAAFLLLEKLFLGRWLKRVPVLGHVYVLLAALFSFVLFDAASVPAALGTAGGLLGLGGLPLWDSGALYYLRSYAPVLALAAVGSTPLPAALCRRIAAGRAGRVLDALEPAALLALLAVCTAFLVSGSANPFLYFRF